MEYFVLFTFGTSSHLLSIIYITVIYYNDIYINDIFVNIFFGVFIRFSGGFVLSCCSAKRAVRQ
jgi:hypothetical protein